MAQSLIATLIQDSVSASVTAALKRHADVVAEGLVDELLRDHDNRELFRKLVQQAFTNAWLALNQPPQGNTP